MPEDRLDLCRRTAVIRHSPEGIELALPRQAETDTQLISLWLHGRSAHTVRAYRADAERFLAWVGRPLHGTTLGDIQAFADALDAEGLQPASRHRMLAAVKSLFAFGHRLGYLPFDAARPLRLPAFRDALADRILSEAEVGRMIALEPNPRNQAILLTLYGSGVRVSELSGMRWEHLHPREDAGQVTVFGKGGKTRSILLPPSVWRAINLLRRADANDAPVFRSRKNRPLCAAQVTRIVKAAGKRARIPRAATSHFLRHAHASHSLERGAPIHLVQATLGHASLAVTGRYLHARPSESSSRFLPL